MQGRIMLVDPDRISLTMLRVCLEQMEPELEIVGQATNVEEALRTAIESQPDVVLMEFALPRLTGVEAARWIMRAAPEARVILLSEHDEPWIRERSSQLGIFGMLRKDEPLTDLHRMVVQALQAPPQATAFHASPLPAPDQPESSARKRRALSLSRREDEIMRLATLGHTTQGIANEVGITRQTVRDHFKHIYGKLGVHTRTQAVLVFHRRKS